MDPRKIAIVMLHPGCNMTCKFCVSEESFSSMSWRQALSLLDLLKKCGIGNVVFGGGEPFTWDHDLVRLAGVAKREGFLTQVGTNGIWMPAGIEASPVFDRFILPLESADADLHNSLRYFRRHHHEIIVDRLERLREARRTVTISTVVTRQNIGALVPLAEWLSEYVSRGGQIHAWHLYKFVPEGRGGRPNAAELEVTTEDYNASCDPAKKMGLAFPIYKRPNMFRSRTVHFFWYQGGRLQAVGPEAPFFRLPHDEDHIDICRRSFGNPCLEIT